ncbi:hypothetical protein DV736_g4429, partial [Chaetothyriales sp. CBS 134916]
MSDLLKQGQSLLSSATGGATGGAAGGQSSGNQAAGGNVVESFAAKGVNAIEAQLGFDKDHKYDKYEQQGIDAIEKQLKK